MTRDLYNTILGENATPAQRFHMQATWLAADTEFWRAHRKAAAVMHFTTLGYDMVLEAIYPSILASLKARGRDLAAECPPRVGVR